METKTPIAIFLVVAALFAAALPTSAREHYVPDEGKDSLQRTEFRVRSNAADLIPFANLGAELRFGGKWSAGADWHFPWIWRERHGDGVDVSGNCLEMLGLDLELLYIIQGSRKRFADNGGRPRKSAEHSLGAYAHAGYYDLARERKGGQGEFAGTGVIYRYSLPVFKGKAYLGLGLGAGVVFGQNRSYQSYERGGKCYSRPGDATRLRYFGPTRLILSLSVPVAFGKARAITSSTTKQ